MLLRVLPAGVYAGRAGVVLERSALVYRRAWVVIFSGFFEPLFYLLSFGAGLGALVGGVSGPNGQPLSYAQYIAPALLASSAMNGAIADSTMNVFYKLKYAKLYDGMLATSLGPMDIALGEIGWALGRAGLYAAGFVIVMLAMRLLLSPWALLLVPAALLIALRLRRGRDGGHHLPARLAGPGTGHRGHAADVPVLWHLLQPERLPGHSSDRGGVPTVAPRRGAAAQPVGR